MLKNGFAASLSRVIGDNWSPNPPSKGKYNYLLLKGDFFPFSRGDFGSVNARSGFVGAASRVPAAPGGGGTFGARGVSTRTGGAGGDSNAHRRSPTVAPNRSASTP